MKNLLILVPGLWLGGQERIAAETADLMSEEYNVTLAVFDISNAVYLPSCKVIDLNIPAKTGKLNKIVNVLKRARAVKSLKKKYHIDTVYSFGGSANIVNCMVSNVRHYISLHGFESTTLKRWEQALYKRANIIFCVSKVIKDEIDKKNAVLSNKTVVLYNPYDCMAIMKKAKDNVDDYSFSSHTIVSHGRLDEVKNWPRLIKAFFIVKKAYNDAKLLIIGEGSQRSELERVIIRYGLEDCVALIGFRSNPFAYIARSTIYVLPSYSEGFPNSLIEGMAFLPVVSVDCKSGPREILSNGNVDLIATGYEISDYGVLVKPASDQKHHDEITKDDEILADAILTVFKNPILSDRLKEMAQNRVVEFSCERYKKRLSEILENDQKE